jgi:hypothetical protein
LLYAIVFEGYLFKSHGLLSSATGINDTSDTCGKFITGVVDTGGAL